MNKRELARIVLSEGDLEDRVSALLELLEVPSYECKLPEGKLEIPEDTCYYCDNGICWINMPDSMHRCTGKCAHFK